MGSTGQMRPNPMCRPGIRLRTVYQRPVEFENPITRSRTGSTSWTPGPEAAEERDRMPITVLSRRASINRRVHTCGDHCRGGLR